MKVEVVACVDTVQKRCFPTASVSKNNKVYNFLHAVNIHNARVSDCKNDPLSPNFFKTFAVMGFCHVFLFLLCFVCFCDSSSSCKRGLGNAADQNGETDITWINLHRGDGPSWFFDNYMATGKPVAISTSSLRQFSVAARFKWDDDSYLLNSIGKDTEVDVLVSDVEGHFDKNARWEKYPFLKFLEKHENNANVLLDTPLPEGLKNDTEKDGLKFWKWIPCFDDLKKLEGEMQRNLVFGSGGPQETDIKSDPRDLMVYVVKGQRKFVLYPPDTNFSKSMIVRSFTAHTSVETDASADKRPLTIILSEGDMLYVPLMWYRKSVNYCRHLSLEHHYDLRGLLKNPWYKKVYMRGGNMEIFKQMTDPKMAKSVPCKECAHLDHKKKWETWKRNTLMATIAVVLIVTITTAYYAKEIVREEKDKKTK